MAAHDMLVKLYEVERDEALLASLKERGVSIKRAMNCDLSRVLEYVKTHFSEGWRDECHAAIFSNTCYIAARDNQIVGFACCETTAKGFFGPTGVTEAERGQGIGKALLIECLLLQKALGYAYSIIGWTDDATLFYEKTVGAMVIPDSHPGVFANLISK